MLNRRRVPHKFIAFIQDIYTNNLVQVNQQMTELILLEKGVRYQQVLKIVCYADDVALIPENEDDLQCLLFQLNV